MSTPLVHSPADVVRYLLIAMNLGSDPATSTVSWPVYATSEPSAPDDVITVYDTQGMVFGRNMLDGESVEHFGIQIRLRSQDHATGWKKMKGIARQLEEEIYQESITIQGSVYCVRSIKRTSSVLVLGKDTPGSKRSIFTLNALCSIRQTV